MSAFDPKRTSENRCPEFPFVVEIMVPARLDDMHAFHRQRRITDHHIPHRRDGEHDYIRWCFKDLATAEAFASQFSGTVLLPK
jgi:hypothetical protein